VSEASAGSVAVTEQPTEPRSGVAWPSIRTLLSKDPALRYVDAGRALLQWLDAHAVDVSDWSPLVEAVPSHWSPSLARLAHQYAKEWSRFAEQLEDQAERTD
jgi:hypothetical protein